MNLVYKLLRRRVNAANYDDNTFCQYALGTLQHTNCGSYEGMLSETGDGESIVPGGGYRGKPVI